MVIRPSDEGFDSPGGATALRRADDGHLRPREIAADMQRISDRCPNPECENSLGGSFQKAQFEKLEEGVWECRQCGLVRDL